MAAYEVTIRMEAMSDEGIDVAEIRAEGVDLGRTVRTAQERADAVRVESKRQAERTSA